LRATPRDALVLLLLPHQQLHGSSYLEALEAAAADIAHWYASIAVIIAGTAREFDRAAHLTIVGDTDAAVHRRLGIAPDRAALLVVDRYGQTYEVVEADRPERLPAMAEIEQWTRFLATQCPECGVIDEPGRGEWSD
jgi:hypothetical protein